MARERLDPSPLQMQQSPSTFISSGCWKEVWQWYTVLCKRAYFANFVKATKCKYSKVQMPVDQHSLHRRQIVTILLKKKKIKKKWNVKLFVQIKMGGPRAEPGGLTHSSLGIAIYFSWLSRDVLQPKPIRLVSFWFLYGVVWHEPIRSWSEWIKML